VNGFSNTTFKVYMDGQLAITNTLVSQDANVLFEKSGLPSGRHNITIQNTPDSSNKAIQQLALGGATVLYTVPNGYVCHFSSFTIALNELPGYPT
jgi:hypothetical protein